MSDSVKPDRIALQSPVDEYERWKDCFATYGSYSSADTIFDIVSGVADTYFQICRSVRSNEGVRQDSLSFRKMPAVKPIILINSPAFLWFSPPEFIMAKFLYDRSHTVAVLSERNGKSSIHQDTAAKRKSSNSWVMYLHQRPHSCPCSRLAGDNEPEGRTGSYIQP